MWSLDFKVVVQYKIDGFLQVDDCPPVFGLKGKWAPAKSTVSLSSLGSSVECALAFGCQGNIHRLHAKTNLYIQTHLQKKGENNSTYCSSGRRGEHKNMCDRCILGCAEGTAATLHLLLFHNVLYNPECWLGLHWDQTRTKNTGYTRRVKCST